MQGVGAVASLSPLSAAGRAHAQPQDFRDYFRDKTVRLLVGSPPGGGYDLYTRMIAPYLAKRLGCMVIVENRSGGGGLLALSYMLTRPADGLTLMLASAEAATLSQLLQREGANWDVGRLQWLARVGSSPKIWFVGRKGKYKDFDALKNAPQIAWAATGKADNISDVASVISYITGLRSRMVVGYRGAGDMTLAVINGEADSGVLSADSALPNIRNGELSPIATFDSKRWPSAPDVPSIYEIVKVDPARRWISDIRQQIGEAQRALVAAPDTPPAMVEFLRQVSQDVLTDPALLEEGRKTNRELDFQSGVELQRQLVGALKISPAQREEMKKIMLEMYF
jgi:tripartite-type tricarboxylate transporter receptor subunit TctC